MSTATGVLKEPGMSCRGNAKAQLSAFGFFLPVKCCFLARSFFLYTIYRVSYPQAFIMAGRETNIYGYGTINTAVLMTSQPYHGSRSASSGGRHASSCDLVSRSDGCVRHDIPCAQGI